jgi:hypothetical protein
MACTPAALGCVPVQIRDILLFPSFLSSFQRNHAWRVVDLSYISEDGFPWELLDSLLPLTSLTELDLATNPVRSPGWRERPFLSSESNDLHPLWKLGTLTSLRLSGVDISDVGLSILTALGSLRTLALDDCRLVNDFVLRFSLAPLVSLTSLDLSNNSHVTDVGLKSLSPLRSLETLRIGSCPLITGVGLGYLVSLESLTSLDFGNRVNTIRFGCVNVRSGLTRISGAGLRALAPLTCLVSLDLGSCLVRDTEMSGLGSLVSLTSLKLSLTRSEYSPVSDSGLAELASLGRLKILELGRFSRITGVGLFALSLVNLLELDLRYCESITDVCLGALVSAQLLERLCLRGCVRVTCVGFSVVAPLPSLLNLDLSLCTSVSDEGLLGVVRFSKMLSLDLSSCTGVTLEGVGVLTSATRSSRLVVAHGLL